MSNSKLALTISITLTDHPRANLVPWKLAIKRAAHGVFTEWGRLRARPDFPEPAALETGANPAARDAFKRATHG